MAARGAERPSAVSKAVGGQGKAEMLREGIRLAVIRDASPQHPIGPGHGSRTLGKRTVDLISGSSCARAKPDHPGAGFGVGRQIVDHAIPAVGSMAGVHRGCYRGRIIDPCFTRFRSVQPRAGHARAAGIAGQQRAHGIVKGLVHVRHEEGRIHRDRDRSARRLSEAIGHLEGEAVRAHGKTGIRDVGKVRSRA